MSSSPKSYNISGSKYGALEALPQEVASIKRRNSPTYQQEDEEATYKLPTPQPKDLPPKPAVRHRIQTGKIGSSTIRLGEAINSDSLVAKNTLADISTTIVAGKDGGYQNQAFQFSNDPDQASLERVSIIKSSANNNSNKNSYTLPLAVDLPANRGESPTNQNTDDGSSNANNQDQQVTQSSSSSSPNHQPTRAYPKKVLFIVGNEFCERFSYYGLRTILVLYFKSVLGLTDSASTVSFHLFATLCYLTPILGAILGDSIWGKFRTILYLSIVYFLGEVTLVLSAIYWQEGALSTAATFFGLLLIGIGTGGIKPCVSALGGDQFLANEEKWRQNFFSLFYGAINLGSLISMFITPMLRSNYNCVNRSDCYPFAFGLPCALMFVGIVVFLVAKNQYVLVPLPEQNVIVAFCHCTYLALKRKVLGQRPELSNKPIVKMSRENSDSSASTSSLSEVGTDVENRENGQANAGKQSTTSLPNEREDFALGHSQKDGASQLAIVKRKTKGDHWLYLASDRYNKRMIEDFRSVWNIMLIFLPTSIYWCLFDQQGSMWTLQATRMDGRVFNTGFILQPDQMSVANPLLLLASIPLFQMIIYPGLSKCRMLTKPIQRMTVGGLLAALTFVLSALIELRIQQFTPSGLPAAGSANLLIVNGLIGCQLASPTISLATSGNLPVNGLITLANASNLNSIPTLTAGAAASGNLDSSTLAFDSLQPLSSNSLEVNLMEQQLSAANNYKLKFRLSDSSTANSSIASQKQLAIGFPANSSAANSSQCPLSSQVEHELNIGQLTNQSSRFVYVGQGNGKLVYKLFPNSLELPGAGKARVQLLYDSFGSIMQSTQRQFSLIRLSSIAGQQNYSEPLKFKTSLMDGQVILSQYLDVPVPGKGDLFALRTSDNLINPLATTATPDGANNLLLKPGTRNLIVVHQKSATEVELRQELLLDNDYRISMLYQLAPYLLISMSEVMFSITGLEFSYASAPSNMKSVILGAWSLMVALGNLLTVAVESAHFFLNVANDFLFYAVIMAIDMAIFAYIGFRYKPYKREED